MGGNIASTAALQEEPLIGSPLFAGATCTAVSMVEEQIRQEVVELRRCVGPKDDDWDEWIKEWYSPREIAEMKPAMDEILCFTRGEATVQFWLDKDRNFGSELRTEDLAS